MRTLNRSALVTALSTLTFGVACNSILGIDEGHLVSGDAGSGAGGKRAGSGGESSTDDGGASGGKSGGTGGAAGGGKGSGGTSDTDGGIDGGGAVTGTGGVGGRASTGVANEVACGAASCKITSNQACCIGTTDGSNPHCSTSCDSAQQTRFTCDGAEDCTTGQKCCFPIAGTAATCSAACTGRIICGADADCNPGQRCVPGTGALLKNVFICEDAPTDHALFCDNKLCGKAEACCYDKAAKTAKCTVNATCPANNVRYACDGPEDCDGKKCCPTATGLGVFTGTQCLDTCATGAIENTCGGVADCNAGFLCCQGGAATTGAACGGACVKGQVCGNDSDCTPTGEVCTLQTDTALGTQPGRSLCTGGPPR